MSKRSDKKGDTGMPPKSGEEADDRKKRSTSGAIGMPFGPQSGDERKHVPHDVGDEPATDTAGDKPSLPNSHMHKLAGSQQNK